MYWNLGNIIVITWTKVGPARLLPQNNLPTQQRYGLSFLHKTLPKWWLLTCPWEILRYELLQTKEGSKKTLCWWLSFIVRELQLHLSLPTAAVGYWQSKRCLSGSWSDFLVVVAAQTVSYYFSLGLCSLKYFLRFESQVSNGILLGRGKKCHSTAGFAPRSFKIQTNAYAFFKQHLILRNCKSICGF